MKHIVWAWKRMRESLVVGFMKSPFGCTSVLCHCCVYCNHHDCSFSLLNYLYLFSEFLFSVVFSCPKIIDQVLKGGHNRLDFF